ncbi:MAG: hypothetical protein V4459_08625 [Pseudomonadota bacterium]
MFCVTRVVHLHAPAFSRCLLLATCLPLALTACGRGDATGATDPAPIVVRSGDRNFVPQASPLLQRIATGAATAAAGDGRTLDLPVTVGDVDQSFLVEAQTTLLQARLALLSARTTRLSDMVELLQAMGVIGRLAFLHMQAPLQ